MPSNQSNLVQELDNLIRQGQGNRARAELLKLNHTKLARDMKVEIASLASRANLPELAVKILNPIVRPPKGVPSSATEREKAEYGIGLINIGAVTEGMKVLEKLDAEANPRIYLLLALGAMAQWDYVTAIPYLKNAIQSSKMADYQKLVCRVNLSSALVHERHFKEAVPLLEELKKETEKNYPLLYGTVLKYWAELKIEMKDLDGARLLIQEAQEVLGNFGGRDSLFIKKWAAIIELIAHKAGAKSLAALEDVQEAALKEQNWDTVRDCDFYKAKFAGNPTTLAHLYFGTPFKSYREWIKREWKASLDLPEQYKWVLKGSNSTHPLDLLSGEKTTKGDKLKVGQNMHRLLCIFSTDFYRPFRIASLHALLFPGEYFNPVTSPDKVHAVMKRLRVWFKDNHVPLTIAESSKRYHLKATGPCAINVLREGLLEIDANAETIKKLKEKFPSGFSVPQAQKFLELSQNSVLALLGEAMESGEIMRTGKARATRYHFAADLPINKAA